MARGTDLQMGTDWWFGWMVKDLERIRKLVTRMSREEVNPPPSTSKCTPSVELFVSCVKAHQRVISAKKNLNYLHKVTSSLESVSFFP